MGGGAVTAPGIVWIVSYPKSGNTWVRLLLSTLAAGGALPDLSRPLPHCPHSAARVWIENVLDIPTSDLLNDEVTALRKEAIRRVALVNKPPFWLKAHDSYDSDLFPAEVTAGIIHVLRDPRDVAPSWADHMAVSLDEAIRRMNLPDFTMAVTGADFRPQARQRLGSWSGNVTSWLDGPPGPVLTLRYEDMQADPTNAVRRIGAFVGLPTPPDIVAATVAACDFARLKAAEGKSGFLERMGHQRTFFRQGRAGAWRDTLTEDQAERLWRDHGATMTRLGYDRDGSSP